MKQTMSRILRLGLVTLALAPAGCASGPPQRVSLSVTRLVADAMPAPAQAVPPVDLFAVPVQLDSVEGPGLDAEGNALFVGIRMLRGSMNTTSDAAGSVVRGKPGRRGGSRGIGDQMPFPVANELLGPALGNQTIPLLPYGAFWIEVTNRGDRAIVVDPKPMHLRYDGQTRSALPDSGALEGRYQLVLLDLPPIGSEEREAHHALPILRRRVTLPPGGSWRGYVVFDTGSYTADEYNDFLAQSGGITLELSDGSLGLAAAHFEARRDALAALCPAGTRKPSFDRCGILPE